MAALSPTPALAPAGPALAASGVPAPKTPTADPEAEAAQANFKRNQAFVLPGDNSYFTTLPSADEQTFRQWVTANKVPFDPESKTADYDMRGYWKDVASRGTDARKKNPNDNKMHFPDTYKTPYHKSFSSESHHADPSKAPRWNNKDQLVTPDGKVVFDERAKD